MSTAFPKRRASPLMRIVASVMVLASLVVAFWRSDISAFVAGSSPRSLREGGSGVRGAWIQTSVQASPSSRMQGGSSAGLHSLACLAILVAALRRPSAPSSAPSSARAKVVCAIPTPQMQPLKFRPAVAPRSAQQVVTRASASAEDIMSLPIQGRIPAATNFVQELKDLLPAISVCCEARATPSFGSAARCIGGVRSARARQARGQAFSSKAQRRHHGARLQASRQSYVVPASFDSSRVRMQIQIGLRKARPAAERRREPYAQMSSDGICVLEGISCMAGYSMFQIRPQIS